MVDITASGKPMTGMIPADPGRIGSGLAAGGGGEGPPDLSPNQIAEIQRLAARADHLVDAAHSANTRRAYATAWRQWSAWCLGFNLDPVVADARWLVLHLTALAETRSLSTIELRRAGVLAIRRRLGFPLHLEDATIGEATFQTFLQGLRRSKGARREKKVSRWSNTFRRAGTSHPLRCTCASPPTI